MPKQQTKEKGGTRLKVLKWLDKNFEEAILVVFLIVITIVMSVQIVARIFNSALTWSEELARFLFVWSGFLSISYCFREQISIKIEQVVDMLPTRVASVIKLLEKAIMLVFYLYMLQFAYDYYTRAIASGQLSPAMQIPMAMIQIAPLVGFILSIIRLIQSVFAKSRELVTGEAAEKKAEINVNM